MSGNETVLVRNLGLKDYHCVWRAMANFTDRRTESNSDELWVVQHPRVFTQGQAGKAEHVLMPGDIPVVQVDRGGQVTYHGPGQLVVYPLVDLRRRGMGVRELVSHTEDAIVAALQELALEAYPKADAPGVYIKDDKIASLGFRIRKGKSFHGLSLNVAMDMEPFLRINPCGYNNLKMIQTSELTADPRAASVDAMADLLLPKLVQQLGYTAVEHPRNPERVLSEYADE